MAHMNSNRFRGQSSPHTIPRREPRGQNQPFGLWTTPHSHHDIFIYVEPPRVRHFHNQHERFNFGQRVRNGIARIYLCLTRFYNLVLEEYYKYQAQDDQLRRSLHLLIHETALLLSRTSFAISQFSITPTSWISTLRLNEHLIGVAEAHSALTVAFFSLRNSNRYQAAFWRNYRLFF